MPAKTIKTKKLQSDLLSIAEDFGRQMQKGMTEAANKGSEVMREKFDFEKEIKNQAKGIVAIMEKDIFGKVDVIFENKMARFTGFELLYKNFKENFLHKAETALEKIISFKSKDNNLVQAGKDSGKGWVRGFKKAAAAGIIGGIALTAFALFRKIYEYAMGRIEYTSKAISEYGLGVEQASKLYDITRSTNKEAKRWGFSLKDNFNSAVEIFNYFMRTKDANYENIKLSNELQKRYNITAEAAAQVLHTQKNILGLTHAQTKARLDELNALEKVYGVLGFSSEEMLDIVTNSENLNKYSYDNITKGYLTAKKMRLEYDQLLNITEGIAEVGDFETMIEKSAKMAAYFGVNLDAMELTLAKMNDDTAGVAEQLREAFKGKDIMHMNTLQKKFMADFLGGYDKLTEFQLMIASASDSAAKADWERYEAIKEIKGQMRTNLEYLNMQKPIWKSINVFLESIRNLFDKHGKKIEAFMRGFSKGITSIAEDILGVTELNDKFNEKSAANFEKSGTEFAKNLTGTFVTFTESINTLVESLNWIIDNINSLKKIKYFIPGVASQEVGNAIWDKTKKLYNRLTEDDELDTNKEKQKIKEDKSTISIDNISNNMDIMGKTFDQLIDKIGDSMKEKTQHVFKLYLDGKELMAKIVEESI